MSEFADEVIDAAARQLLIAQLRELLEQTGHDAEGRRTNRRHAVLTQREGHWCQARADVFSRIKVQQQKQLTVGAKKQK